MGEIIKIEDRRKWIPEDKKHKENLSEITNKYTIDDIKKKDYCIIDAILIAEEILGIYSEEVFAATPIIRIIQNFDFMIYNSDLSNLQDGRISGVMEVNGRTKELYGADKVIITNCIDPIEQQRFVAAHELGHYIMDCLGDPQYLNLNHLYRETYRSGEKINKKERRADQFAAELLMPKKKFVYRYMVAVNQCNGNKEETYKYLSEYFQVKIESVEKRIQEILNYEGC